MTEVYTCLKDVGSRNILHVSTQGIAKWVERWSFVSLGEDGVDDADNMQFKREINYYDNTNCCII